MRTVWIFFILCLCLCAINLLTEIFIFSENIFYSSFESQLDYYKIAELIRIHNEWRWLSYVLIPLLYFIKLTLVSVCLMIGAFIFDRALNYRQSFNTALKAEFILLIEPVIKLIWFSIITTPKTLFDVENFMPFSVSGLLETNQLDIWQKYLFNTINLFLFLYVASLILDLRKYYENQTILSAKIVLAGYLPGYLIWVLSVTFIFISVS